MSTDKSPFITGSHAYGAPTADSDIDLVVWAVGKTRETLAAGGYPVRFGKLNLILVSDNNQWEIWRIGTQSLVKLSESRNSPVSREEAKAVFIALGITQSSTEEPYSSK